MNSSLETELYRATALTFEELGFMLPSAELRKEQERARFEAAVGIDFHGEFCGRLVLSVCGGILPSIVQNMLGEGDSKPDRSARADALGELANVICGNVLPGIAGSRATFSLDPPRLVPEAEAKRGGPEVTRVRVGLERGRAEVVLILDAAGTPASGPSDSGTAAGTAGGTVTGTAGGTAR